MADPSLDSRIAIVGPGALELACALIRGGYQTVSVLRIDDRICSHEADIVIVPQPAAAAFPASAAFIERVVPFAHRLLAPLGMLVLRLPNDRTELLLNWARRQLLLNGFSGIRVGTGRGETLLGAGLPAHGRLT